MAREMSPRFNELILSLDDLRKNGKRRIVGDPSINIFNLALGTYIYKVIDFAMDENSVDFTPPSGPQCFTPPPLNNSRTSSRPLQFAKRQTIQ